jgi:hypothetical protein
MFLSALNLFIIYDNTECIFNLLSEHVWCRRSLIAEAGFVCDKVSSTAAVLRPESEETPCSHLKDTF